MSTREPGLEADEVGHETEESRPRSETGMGWLLLIAGAVGLTGAAALVLERIALLTDPGHTPSCSLNPVLNCGSVMVTDQASVFGFPNPLIGLAAFPVVIVTGAMLLSGGRPGRWYWLGMQAGVTFGIGFVCWLIFQSIYRIGALCPYCMVVWAAMIPLFWYVTGRNLSAGVFGESVARSGAVRFLRSWSPVLLTLVVVALLAMILEQFWYYWSTLL